MYAKTLSQASWLPQEYIKPNTSEYVQGVEVSIDYSGEIPEGFDVIELPSCKYIMFQGEPFEKEDFAEPIGTRGYIKLCPVKSME